jgi:hypothetical protein
MGRFGDSSSEVNQRVVQDLFEASGVRPSERWESNGPGQLPSKPRAFGLQAAQQTSHFGLSGVQALRGEHPSIERELATIGDRGTATAAFDEPN